LPNELSSVFYRTKSENLLLTEFLWFELAPELFRSYAMQSEGAVSCADEKLNCAEE